MVVDRVPACVREIANGAKHICPKGFSYSDFVTFLCGLFFGLKSLSAITRFFPFAHSVSQLGRASRHIPHENLLSFNRKRLSRMVNGIEKPQERFVLATDDTLVRKFGLCPENCYWFDHTNNSTAKGRNYLVIAILDTYTGQAFPVSVVLLYGTQHANYHPRADHLKEQLLVLKEAGLGNLTLVADSWFADKELFEWLDKQGFDFEIEVKRNRKVTYLDKKVLGTLGKTRKVVYPKLSDVASTLKRNTAFSGGAPKQVAGGVVRLYGSSLRLKLACVWNEKDSKSQKPFAYYVTNKTNRCLSRIWALSRFRWGIESYFRNGKQDFAFDALPFEDGQAAFSLLVMGMFLVSSLELKRFVPEAKPIDIRSRPKTYVSLSSFVKTERNKSLQSTFRAALHFPKRKEVLIKHFQGRGHPDFACLKPRDKIKKDLLLQQQSFLRT